MEQKTVMFTKTALEPSRPEVSTSVLFPAVVLHCNVTMWTSIQNTENYHSTHDTSKGDQFSNNVFSDCFQGIPKCFHLNFTNPLW